MRSTWTLPARARALCPLALAGLLAVVIPATAHSASLRGTLTRGAGKHLTYKISDSGVAINRFQLQFGFSLTQASCPALWQKGNAVFATAFTCDGIGGTRIAAGQTVTGTVTTKFCLPAGTSVRGQATLTNGTTGVPPDERFTLTAPRGNCSSSSGKHPSACSKARARLLSDERHHKFARQIASDRAAVNRACRHR